MAWQKTRYLSIPMRSAFLSNFALLVALVYLLSPVDLIPDLLGPIGRLDDLLLLIFVALRAITSKIWHQVPSAKRRASHRPSDTEKDPYAVFGLEPGASKRDIETRFRELAKDYHPDRVAHLGEELRKVAHEKMIEIQRAYDRLTES